MAPPNGIINDSIIDDSNIVEVTRIMTWFRKSITKEFFNLPRIRWAPRAQNFLYLEPCL